MPHFRRHPFRAINRFRMRLSAMKHFGALFGCANERSTRTDRTICAQTFNARTLFISASHAWLQAGCGLCEPSLALCSVAHAQLRAAWRTYFSERAMGATFQSRETPRGRPGPCLANARPARLRGESRDAENNARSIAHRAHETRMNHFSLSLRKSVSFRRGVGV
jgi:hypothetical protein